MLVKILGLLDFVSSFILIFALYKFLPTSVILTIGVLVLLKSTLGLFQDVASWIDFFAGAILFLTLSNSVPWIVCFIAGIFVLQKGLFSFL